MGLGSITRHNRDQSEKHPSNRLDLDPDSQAGIDADHAGRLLPAQHRAADWSEERLWHIYILLTDLEAVFRSLQSELGLRPIFHSKESRTDGHLFISVLAYQCVQLIRRQLKAKGIDTRWAELRETLSVQRRVTVSFTRKDGRTLQVRKATQPEGILRTIYHILGLDPLPGATKNECLTSPNLPGRRECSALRSKNMGIFMF
ncbi:MAG: hypothetical protein ACRERU_17635 [Methylococcales bacterium]